MLNSKRSRVIFAIAVTAIVSLVAYWIKPEGIAYIGSISFGLSAVIQILLEKGSQTNKNKK